MFPCCRYRCWWDNIAQRAGCWPVQGMYCCLSMTGGDDWILRKRWDTWWQKIGENYLSSSFWEVIEISLLAFESLSGWHLPPALRNGYTFPPRRQGPEQFYRLSGCFCAGNCLNLAGQIDNFIKCSYDPSSCFYRLGAKFAAHLAKLVHGCKLLVWKSWKACEPYNCPCQCCGPLDSDCLICSLTVFTGVRGLLEQELVWYTLWFSRHCNSSWQLCQFGCGG